MRNRIFRLNRSVSILLFTTLLGTSGVAVAGDQVPESTLPGVSGAEESISIEPLEKSDQWPDGETSPTAGVVLVGSGSLGYRVYHSEGGRSGVTPYDDVRSGPEASLQFTRLGKELKLSIDAGFVTDADYLAEADIDYNGRYRFHLLSHSLHHNLFHYPAFTAGTVTLPSPPGRTYTVLDLDPTASYGIDASQSSASFRYRMPSYPLHLNLQLWQLTREGSRQLRFADSVRDQNSANTLYLKTRPVDSATTELMSSVDGHFGFLDAVYSFLYRQHDEKAASPRDEFAGRGVVPGATVSREHSVQPDTSYFEQTVKLHTSMTGAVVGAVSYSLGERKNEGRPTDYPPFTQPSDTVQTGAADLHLTFSPTLSLALRYRHTEIDKEGPSELGSGFLTTGTLATRPGIDLRRESLTAALLYRPFTLLTVKGEYAGVYTSRSHVDVWPALEPSTETHRTGLSFILKPLKGLRMRGSYAYTFSPGPAYATSPEDRHDARLLATYVRSGKGLRWGATLSGKYLRESNDERFTLEATPRPMPRDRVYSTANGTVWLAPSDRFSVSAAFGYHWNAIDQRVLLQFDPILDFLTDTRFEGTVQYAGLTLTHQPFAPLSLSAGYQNIRSRGSFVPESRVISPIHDTSGITDISRTDVREHLFSLRAEYRLFSTVSCAIDYLFRDSEARDSSLLDGTVHRLTASLTSRW